MSKRKVGSEATGGRGISEGGHRGHRGHSIEWPIRGGSTRKGTLFSLQVCERVGKSVIVACERT